MQRIKNTKVMYIQKVSLEEALEMESMGQITIASTSRSSKQYHESETQWRKNYENLRMGAPHVSVGSLFTHYPAPYMIEHLVEQDPETGSTMWRYYRGIVNPDAASIQKDNVEYVYILTNKDYPNLVKIGMTVKSPEKRLESINSTGVVTHWELAFALPIIPKSSYKVEQQVHNHFASRRYHSVAINDKEMFNVSLQEATDEVRRIGQYFSAGMPRFYQD